MARLFLIDGSGYLYRAFFAVRNLSRRDGFPTNAIFGFTKMVRKILSDHQPDYLCMVFDAKGPTFRHEMDADYKSNRKPMPEELVIQIPIIHKVVAAHGIPLQQVEGVEADDVMGTLSHWGRAKGLEVVVVTGDKDLMQLIAPGIRLLDPQRGGWIDEEEATTYWGVPPAKATDILGLAGDSSDNIPGVPGIGMKTAAELIQEFGSLEGVLENVAKIRQPKRRELLMQYGEQARKSKELATIRCDLPLDPPLSALIRQEPDRAALIEIFREMEFSSLVREVETVPQTVTAKPVATLALDLEAGEQVERDYQAITNEEALQEFVQQLARQPLFAMDIETTHLNPWQAELVGISFSWQEGVARYLPVGHQVNYLDRQRVLELLTPLLNNPAIHKCGQNLKYEQTTLRKYGIHLAGIRHDAMILSHVLHGPARRHNLDTIALEELGRVTTTFEQVVGTGRQAVTFDQVELARATPYACEDAEVAWTAVHKMVGQLSDPLRKLYEEIEMPLLPILGEMELAGTLIHRPALTHLSSDLARRREILGQDIYQLAGEKFNLNSTQQLGHILFEKLGIKGGKRTKTGFSTDVTVLTRLAEEGHPLPEKILAYRTLTKLQSTYTDALQEQLDQGDRLHTSFNQAVTMTGRLSSTDPNLQNIPTRTEEGRAIRKAFIAPPGWVLLSADYSQIELRLLAHMGPVERLQEAFHQGGDIHRATAAQLFGLAPEEVDDSHRRMAKTINFGLIYGMSPFGLAQRLEISVSQAKIFMESYFKQYQGVQAYMERSVREARSRGAVFTLMGRRVPLLEIASSNRGLRENAERAAINAPLQGSAADLIKLAMIRLDKSLRQHGLQSRMILQVHDELVLEVPQEELSTVTPLVRQAMEGAAQLSIPLLADVGSGENWADAH
ncbi:MAG: DNA polymerase I [Magnetococcales bacterium]|nr:DNA polymerase I [Magnetococcales bacterium]